LASRLLRVLAVIGFVGMLAFVLFRYVGDPVQAMLGDETSPAARARILDALKLDEPAPLQFARFIGRAARGDLGRSFRSGVPVGTLIAQRLPATVELVCIAGLMSTVAGVWAGRRLASRRPMRARSAVAVLALCGVSVPSFVVGTLLMFALAVALPILPAFGRGETVQVGWWTTGLLTPSGLRALVLPSVTLAYFQAALLARFIGSQLSPVLDEEFIRATRARGVPESVIENRHAFRVILTPLLTVGAVQFVTAIASSIVTETVFQWPGLGLLFVQAAADADLPVLSGYFLVVATMFATLGIVLDVLCYLVDPRVRFSTLAASRGAP